LAPSTLNGPRAETPLLDLGAAIVGDHRRPDRTGWVTLADPEGNEFCMERGISAG
jgi:hypothetical protein